MAYHNAIFVKVDILPAQSQYLTAAEPIGQRQGNGHLQFGALDLLNQLLCLLQRVVADFRRLALWSFQKLRRILLYDTQSVRLMENTFQQSVVVPGRGAGQPVELKIAVIVFNVPKGNLPERRVPKAVGHVMLHHVPVVAVGGRRNLRLAFLNPGQRKVNEHHIWVILLYLLFTGVFRAQSV